MKRRSRQFTFSGKSLPRIESDKGDWWDIFKSHLCKLSQDSDSRQKSTIIKLGVYCVKIKVKVKATFQIYRSVSPRYVMRKDRALITCDRITYRWIMAYSNINNFRLGLKVLSRVNTTLLAGAVEGRVASTWRSRTMKSNTGAEADISD
ncbi:hypothetical protein J6590_005989 [Homalodisca vitripennis]|nr:hypothetical protein J6590_005989 [Homalodisca vitripennis]